ncbi:MAG TPA: D-alanine--D-alanine ligase [Thermoanaerobaculia bacterium]|nr:D-alanine--D-alanine ligase [Thermoanaerobaculia bacterium]
MRIGLCFNLKPPDASGDQYEEFDSEETICALENALRANGHDVVRLGWGAEMLDSLRQTPVDGVFNIAEGVGGRGRESQVPAILEMFGIPCSGSSALSIGLTLDKALAKRVAQSAGIPTAPFVVSGGAPLRLPLFARAAAEGPSLAPLRLPLFVKPAAEGSSMGIMASSLCHDEAELSAAISRLAPYGPVLVEEFLPGEEYTVGIVDGEVLGAMQVVPRTSEENFIYSLDVKRDYLNRVDYRLAGDADVKSLALEVWRAFDLRDVARIDVRRDRDGIPNFVEVNPLPGVHPVNSDLVILARLLGIAHVTLIGRIIAAASRRWRQ